MAKVTINIPRHKLRSFLNLTKKLRIGRPIIDSDTRPTSLLYNLNMEYVKKRITPFLLFDWEFFSNELEFE